MTESKPYIVSARKYRPSTFNTVVGQRALTTTLKNAISSGRLAHAYLFCGPRGVGKTSCARIFAKTINCLSPTPDGEACGVCDSCRAVEQGNSFNLVELDAASNNSVDDIRAISEQVNIPPQVGNYRVFIIDEVHMLTSSAFNAFLKTLEEPPKNVIFILATTERHKVIPTILSRCQVYDFRRITVNDIIDHLEWVANTEGMSTEREALGVIALQADGAMRDALSIFDQVAASTNGNISYLNTIESLNVLDRDYFFNIMEIFRKGDVAEALLILQQIVDKGFEPQVFINGLAAHIRNLMMAADTRTLPLLETSAELEKRYLEQAVLLPPEWYYNAIKILNDADFQYRTSSNKRLLIELALIRLCRLLKPVQATPVMPAINQSTTQTSSGPVSAGVRDKMPQPSSGVVAEPTTPPFEKPAESKPHLRSEPDSGAIAERRGEKKFPKSFRISEVSSVGREPREDEKRDSSFTLPELLKVWDNYAERHPEQRILNGAMRTIRPEPNGDLLFIVKAVHPAQKQAFESELDNLHKFLRESLNNDSLTLKIELLDEKEEKQILTPKNLLKNFVEENPELGRFLRAIDAELE